MLGKIKLVILLLCTPLALFAQDYTQTIRGQVRDKQSQITLPGAVISITDINPMLSTSSDEKGNYRLEKIPVGRHNIKVTYIGYKELMMQIVVNSGKEFIFNPELEEIAIDAKEVVITADADKSKAINEMATISVRTVSMEESNRYAGSRNDPARMAANFAGVMGGNDTRNDIIIRGNSPMGLLWRLDGVDIPNPNHFAVNGSTSGPISILNNNTLSNSDFFTGAFPAEYINAQSGVFDLKMRTGNNEQFEYTGQVGVNGFELGAEGPLKRSAGSSFMASYRYSNLGIMNKLGINFGSGSTPIYHDGTFKVHLPLNNGSLSLFGIGGRSEIALLAKNLKAGDLFGSTKFDFHYGGQMFASGLTYTRYIKKSGYLKFIASFGREGYNNKSDSLDDFDLDKKFAFSEDKYFKDRTSVYIIHNQKINAHLTTRNGIILDRYDFIYRDIKYYANTGNYTYLLNSTGGTYLGRAYNEWIIKINEKITLFPGISGMLLSLNNTIALEPRISGSYKIHPLHKINFGYGTHNRMQDLSVYYVETIQNGNYIKTNKNLKFTTAQHLVAGYDFNISEFMRLKAEAYYQWLYRVPVENKWSSFSMLNAGAGFGVPLADSLVNKGTGTNKGLEITLEQFMKKGFYFLTTASLFDSRYKGSDGIERNTAFNGNYVLNGLAGKEFKLKERNFISIDYKIVYAGGKRYTPINVTASQIAMKAVYQDDKAFSLQSDPYFRTDLKVSYKLNSRKTTQEWAISAENLTNHKNLFVEDYNPITGKSIKVYQLGLFVVGFYRINF